MTGPTVGSDFDWFTNPYVIPRVYERKSQYANGQDTVGIADSVKFVKCGTANKALGQFLSSDQANYYSNGLCIDNLKGFDPEKMYFSFERCNNVRRAISCATAS